MDLRTEKLRLIEWIAGLSNPVTIKQLLSLKNSQSYDCGDEIDAEEKSEIEEGIAQADRDELTPHSDVMNRYKK